MKYLGLASVLVFTLSLGMFIPQAGAKSPKQEALALKKQEALALKLQKQEALALKRQEAHALKLQKQEALALKKQEKLEALALKKQEKLEALALKHSGSLGGPNSISGNHVGANSVPEPGTLLLVGGAFAGLVWWRRVRQPRA